MKLLLVALVVLVDLNPDPGGLVLQDDVTLLQAVKDAEVQWPLSPLVTGKVTRVRWVENNEMYRVGTSGQYNSETREVWLNKRYAAIITTVYLRSILVHEFGHALGLPHSPIMSDMMRYRSPQDKYEPTCADRKRLRIILEPYVE